MVLKYAKGWGGARWEHPEMDIHTTWEVMCQNWMWVVKVEAMGRETPFGTYLPTEEYVYLCPL